MLHIDLCLEYMEIVDKQIVDELPKIFIMMLVHKVIIDIQFEYTIIISMSKDLILTINIQFDLLLDSGLSQGR